MKVADRWFETQRIDDDITLIFEPHVVPLLRCNIWHVRGRDRDLVIDTGLGVASLYDFAKDFLKAKTVYILDDRELYGQGVSGLFHKQCDKISASCR